MRLGWFGSTIGVDIAGLTVAQDSKRGLTISGGTLSAAQIPGGGTRELTPIERQILRTQLLGLQDSGDDVHPLILTDTANHAGYAWMGDAPTSAAVAIKDVAVTTAPGHLAKGHTGPRWSAQLDIVDHLPPVMESWVQSVRSPINPAQHLVQLGVPAPVAELSDPISSTSTLTLPSANPRTGGAPTLPVWCPVIFGAPASDLTSKQVVRWSTAIETMMNGAAYIGLVDTTGAVHPIPGRYIPAGFGGPWATGSTSWELGNGLIRIRPIISGGFARLAVEWFDGTAWGNRLKLDLMRGTAPFATGWHSVSIVRSCMDECTIRVAPKPGNLTVELTVARGAQTVRIFYTAGTLDLYGIRTNSPGNSATIIGGAPNIQMLGTTAPVWRLTAHTGVPAVSNQAVGFVGAQTAVASAQFSLGRHISFGGFGTGAKVQNEHRFWVSSRSVAIKR